MDSWLRKFAEVNHEMCSSTCLLTYNIVSQYLYLNWNWTNSVSLLIETVTRLTEEDQKVSLRYAIKASKKVQVADDGW